jgi:hypothetical protein|tara:strand:- start:68 stop:274 length:207 start_codon:yes stop_codon:yes gene_type:complete
MSIETQESRPRIAMKGMLIGTEVVGNYLHLWYASPDGGETDSQIFQMRCVDEAQAKFIEDQHRSVWGL